VSVKCDKTPEAEDLWRIPAQWISFR